MKGLVCFGKFAIVFIRMRKLSVYLIFFNMFLTRCNINLKLSVQKNVTVSMCHALIMTSQEEWVTIIYKNTV